MRARKHPASVELKVKKTYPALFIDLRLGTWAGCKLTQVIDLPVVKRRVMKLLLQVGLAKEDGQGGGAVFDLVGASHVQHCGDGVLVDFDHAGPEPGVLVGLGAGVLVGLVPGGFSLPPPLTG